LEIYLKFYLQKKITSTVRAAYRTKQFEIELHYESEAGIMREILSIINIIDRLVFDCHRAVLFNIEFVSPHTEF
jgi:hypothetical protein